MGFFGDTLQLGTPRILCRYSKVTGAPGNLWDILGCNTVAIQGVPGLSGLAPDGFFGGTLGYTPLGAQGFVFGAG